MRIARAFTHPCEPKIRNSAMRGSTLVPSYFRTLLSLLSALGSFHAARILVPSYIRTASYEAMSVGRVVSGSRSNSKFAISEIRNWTFVPSYLRTHLSSEIFRIPHFAFRIQTVPSCRRTVVRPSVPRHSALDLVPSYFRTLSFNFSALRCTPHSDRTLVPSYTLEF